MKTTNDQILELNYAQGSMPEIFSLVNKVSKNLDKFQRMVLNKTNLTPPQYAVINALGVLGEQGLSLSQLANICYSSRPTMTNLIDILEAKNLVKRVSNPKDRRSLLVKLTTTGKAKQKGAPTVDHIYADCCSILDPEESRNLSLFLKKVNKALKGYLNV
ncbi:MAG: MarR family winged helix-turn-helix transcriptional regulator [Candidatus Hodarchaeales archaeon]|jgi:DNA-binding MarR family transcriptional regulator